MLDYNTNLARKLRQTSTPTEQILWKHLRGAQMNGYKFRRQYPIGPFVLDFYCAAIQLVIEIDGDVHALRSQIKHDQNREQYLKDKGLTIFHVTTHEIIENLDGVLKQIYTLTRRDNNA